MATGTPLTNLALGARSVADELARDFGLLPGDAHDEKIVQGMELAAPEDTTRENILAEAGYEQTYDIDEIITRMPNPDEVNRLKIAPGTPVTEHIRTGYRRRQAGPGYGLCHTGGHSDPAVHNPNVSA
jgi:hypothetical protein